MPIGPLLLSLSGCYFKILILFLLIQDFLIDEKDFVEGPDWIGLNPALPIYIEGENKETVVLAKSCIYVQSK